MTQQSNTTNWVIQGSNGQPQMIKLVQASDKSLTGVMASSVAGQPIKVFKPSTDTTQFQNVGTTVQSQVIRTAGSKVLSKAVPIRLNPAQQKATTKTIRLTPAQMQNIKFVNHNSPQKLTIAPPSPTPVAPTPQPALSPNFHMKAIPPPILNRKRSEDCPDMEYVPETKRSRKSEKPGKGLRHFSMKVCEKVQKKGTTSYNEVADELVAEFTNPRSSSSLADQYDQKNIRRRVYDALNVLMAMNIISKEKKEIKWIGLPTNSLQECIQLEKEKQKKLLTIKEKKKQLNELILNQIAFKNLAQRNKQWEEVQGPPPPNSSIQLPFIVVNTNKKTVIDCSISNDKLEYLFQFNDKFEINDDLDILKSIGMLMGLDTGECTPENLEKIKSMVPKSLAQYVDDLAKGRDQNDLDEFSSSSATSTSILLGAEDLVETQLDEDNSRQSSSNDPLSPGGVEYSDEEPESDLSSDME